MGNNNTIQWGKRLSDRESDKLVDFDEYEIKC